MSRDTWLIAMFLAWIAVWLGAFVTLIITY
jgi:hypothetical protein